MNIKDHINLLINKYNLHFLYKKYIFISMSFTIIKESFQWFLIYLSIIVKQKPELIYNFVLVQLFFYF